MTSHLPPPPPSLKLLEITIQSAQDLAPVSKLLRTYAVAWVDPDQKLTTSVDHHGHTNPTWNYRFVFRVDDNFLNSDTSTITFEIYNVSWLRDIPIGTVQTNIKNVVPPSLTSQKKSVPRYVSLKLFRPSGTLQGRINLDVNLIDGTRRSMPLESELSAASTEENFDKKIASRNDGPKTKLSRSESDGSMTRPLRGGDTPSSKVGSIFSGISLFERLKTAKSTKITATPISVSSLKMRPLPSDMVATMAKGFSATDDTGRSSVFQNWTLSGDDDSQEDIFNNVVTKPEIAIKQNEIIKYIPPPSKPKPLLQVQKSKKNKKPDRGGLLSCFGLSCGFECLCGRPKSKNTSLKNRAIQERKMFLNYAHQRYHHQIQHR